jgi:hypothetical protein
MFPRTKARSAIPVRRYGRIPKAPSRPWEERHPRAVLIFLASGALLTATAIFALW